METKIVNIKSGTKYDIYCGRANKYYNQPCDSIFCNPYVIGRDGSRSEVIAKFRQYAPTNKDLMDSLYLIDNKTLACYCDYPAVDCHCRILIELREEQVRNAAIVYRQTGKTESLMNINNKKEKEITRSVNEYYKSQFDNKKYKLAVIGSRGITQYTPIYKFLDDRIDNIEMIVSGGCKNSPDEIAHNWCQARGKAILIYYPKWKNEDGSTNRAAGFERNKYIIEAADKIVAFYDGSSRGTKDGIDYAKKLNKPCKIIQMSPGNSEIKEVKI